MGFDFRPALKESIKEAGIPRGWSASEHHGRVKLRVRQGAGGAAGQWSKTLPYAWEIGCIGPVTTRHRTIAKIPRLREDFKAGRGSNRVPNRQASRNTLHLRDMHARGGNRDRRPLQLGRATSKVSSLGI